jgi:hypothetical protein
LGWHLFLAFHTFHDFLFYRNCYLFRKSDLACGAGHLLNFFRLLSLAHACTSSKKQIAEILMWTKGAQEEGLTVGVGATAGQVQQCW